MSKQALAGLVGEGKSIIGSVPADLLPVQRLFYPQFWPASEGSVYLQEENGILLSSGSSYSSDDFYNAFFHGLFSLAAAETALAFCCVSAGRLAVEVWHELPSGACQRVHVSILAPCESGAAQEMLIPMPAELEKLRKGYLYFRFTAVDSPCTITRVRWCSLRRPLRSPQLALVITHFRREAEVQAFLASLRGTELEVMLACGKMRLLIVDNSQTLPAVSPDLPGVVILPNANYGGSGGFARGMLEAVRLQFSHCLLLDDDASLGEEGILRIWARHAMAVEDTAVSAILLQAENPFSIIEAAANYNGSCRPIAPNLQLTEFERLKWLWHSPPRADYGAWCGFSFPLSALQWYPFPFFVRGDDVLFPMINHLPVHTMNGVASRVPCFQRKEGPLQVLLATRALLAVNAAILRMKPVKTALYYAKPALNELVSYRYGHCLARHHALWMYANIESTFTEDMDGSRVRAKARELNRFWQPSPAQAELLDPRRIRAKQPARPLQDSLKKLLFALTLNGHLIPFARLLQRHVYQSDLLYRVSYKDAFLASHIIYHDHLSFAEEDDQSRCCRFDQRVGLRCLFLLVTDVVCILLLSPRWTQRAAHAVRRLSSAAFWRETYQLPPLS